jgi:aryl-alcohol dehydrogenase-like predicted oxidoreductase
VGVSNWPAWRIARTLGDTERLGLAPIQVIQPMYNLAKRTAETEILPMARAERLDVITYSPLGGGLLTGKYVGGRAPAQGRLLANKRYTARYAAQTCHDVAERFCAYAARPGVRPVTLAVAWVKAHPAITAPIIGARNVEQLEPSLAAGEYEMSAEQWSEISALTPPVPVATDRDEERESR